MRRLIKQAALLLLVLLCALAWCCSLHAAADDSNSPQQAAQQPQRPMRVLIQADGTAKLVPADEAADVPAGIELPGSGGAAGLVPLWLAEQQQREAEAAARLAEERQRQQREQQELERQREEEQRHAREKEEAERIAAAEAQARAEADAQAQAAQAAAQAEAEALAQAQARAEAEAAARQAEEVQQQQQQHHEHQQQAPHEESSHSSEAEGAPSAEADADAEEAERARQDAIAAEAARAFAEAQVALHGSAAEGQHVAAHDPAQALLDALERASLFRELTTHNAWSMVQAGRPFALLVLCRCHNDDDLDIPALEVTLRAQLDPQGTPLSERFTFLWVRSPAREQFSVRTTYDLPVDAPALVIDNIPIGQHVEKYLFPGRIARPRDFDTTVKIVRWLSDFLLAPSPLPLLVRSTPAPADPVVPGPTTAGKVVDVVGSTFEEVVLRSTQHVLLMLTSPTCPACHNALPVLDALASRIGWSRPDVLVARMDRVHNDAPFVLRFASYPALLLFRSNGKTMDSTEDQGEEPMNRGKDGSRGWRAPLDYFASRNDGQAQGSCNAPLNADTLFEWVMQHTGGAAGGMLGDGGGSSSSVDADGQTSAAPLHEHAEDLPREEVESHAQGTQQAGAAM